MIKGVKYTRMRRNRVLALLTAAMMVIVLPACDGTDESGDATEGSAPSSVSDEPKDAYEEYIRSKLESIDDDKKNTEAGDEAATPTEKPVDLRDLTGALPDDVQVSAMESTDPVDPFSSSGSTDDTPTPTEDPSLSPTEDPDASPTPTPTPYITPDEFEVGKCCIYVNGESDSAYGTEVVTAINKARTDLGYTALVSNKGLATCADRRTREIVALFNHTRPNGLQFYSLAPEHFKAEMLLINLQKAEDAVDTMIKMDPVSRRLIFTEKYQSIGASSFKCNGVNYTVVAFGL